MPVVVEHRKDIPEVFKACELTGIRQPEELKKLLDEQGVVELKVNERVTFDVGGDCQISVGHTGGKQEQAVITQARPLKHNETVRLSPEIGARAIKTQRGEMRLYLYNREEAGETDNPEGFYSREKIRQSRKRMNPDELNMYGAEAEGYEYSLAGQKIYLVENLGGEEYYKRKYGDDWIESIIRDNSLAEVIIVNSLLRESNAYKRFGFGPSDIEPMGFLRFDYGMEGGVLRDYLGQEVYLPVFKKHIHALRLNGCSLRDMITEFTGHIVHEGIHGSAEVPTSPLQPFWEFTSITGQLAYYLSEGYNGCTAYDPNVVNQGMEIIQSGNNDALGHKVGVYAAASLLWRHLSSEFKEFVKTDDPEANPLVRCRNLCDRIRKEPESQERLNKTLGNAIRDATEERFQEIIEQTRRQQ